MRRFQDSLPKSLSAKTAFVLVSIDSDHDTPFVLHAYRQAVSLPEASGVLLHGDAFSVRVLSKLLGFRYRSTGPDQFAHSNLIRVLNTSGDVAYQRVGLSGDDSAVLAAIAHAAN